MKPHVRCVPENRFSIQVGQPAFVYPIDHPSSLVSNKSLVRTSPVVKSYPSGFETENTIYWYEHESYIKEDRY